METLSFEVKNNIAYLAFNRPDAMNSYNHVMADELEGITDQVKNDASIKVLHLSGKGHLFMAGGDLHFFHDTMDTMPKGVMKIVRTLNAAIQTIYSMDKIVLGSVHGSVAGVGMSLMLACDLVIASDATKFTMAYSGIGISPDGGASFNLPRLVGSKKAMEWMLFSNVFSADVALQHGLVNWVVPADKLSDETEKCLMRLIKGPTRSYAQIKKLVNQSWQQNLAQQLEMEAESFAICTATKDFKQGVKSFLNKTKPEFVGE